MGRDDERTNAQASPPRARAIKTIWLRDSLRDPAAALRLLSDHAARKNLAPAALPPANPQSQRSQPFSELLTPCRRQTG